MAEVCFQALRNAPDQQAKYGECSPEEYKRYKSEVFQHRLKDPAMRTFVTTDPDFQPSASLDSRTEGEILGVLTYQRRGMGDSPPNRSLAPARLPEGANLKCLKAWHELVKDWKEGLLEEVGPHYRGEVLAVLPGQQNSGVGTNLCNLLANKALKNSVIVFIETTSHSYPFYENWCERVGACIKQHRSPIKLPETTEPVYENLVRFEPRPFFRPVEYVPKNGTIRRDLPGYQYGGRACATLLMSR